MSPSTDSLRLASTASRRVVSQLGANVPSMALQRAEFEDFMNAYRPTDGPKKEGTETPKPSSSEDTKVDFGKSIKRLIKRGSPSVTNKTSKKEGISRVPTEHSKTVCNELRPPPTSHIKKASKPSPVVVVERNSPVSSPVSLQPPSTFHQKPVQPLPVPEIKSAPEEIVITKPVPPVRNSKHKTESNCLKEDRKSAEPEIMQVTVVRPPSPNPVNKSRKISSQESQKESPSNSQPTTPTEKEGHCLLIARNSMDRFIPPRRNMNSLLSLKVVVVPERKYRVILEIEESVTFKKPISSPSGLFVVDSDEDQRKGCWEQLEAFRWARESKLAGGGMLLVNVEKNTEFPFITFLTVNSAESELCQKVNHIRNRPLPPDHQQLHFVGGYEEAVTICRPPFPSQPERPASNTSGFVISLYQVHPGEDGQRFEQNWFMWTGARQIYVHAPEHMGLRKISVYKSILPTEVIIYAVLCEFSYIMNNLTEACVLVDQLRARCCGFTGIYRVLDVL